MAATFKEMLEQTKINIVGICKGVNVYKGKDKEYHSVDLEIKGTKMPVNIKLPDNYDERKLVDYELVNLRCIVKPSFDKKAIELHAEPSMA